jgi:hypothetical protein
MASVAAFALQVAARIRLTLNARDNLSLAPVGPRIARMVREDVAIEAYDPRWPDSFEREQQHLRSCLPAGTPAR